MASQLPQRVAREGIFGVGHLRFLSQCHAGLCFLRDVDIARVSQYAIYEGRIAKYLDGGFDCVVFRRVVER